MIFSFLSNHTTLLILTALIGKLQMNHVIEEGPNVWYNVLFFVSNEIVKCSVVSLTYCWKWESNTSLSFVILKRITPFTCTLQIMCLIPQYKWVYSSIGTCQNTAKAEPNQYRVGCTWLDCYCAVNFTYMYRVDGEFKIWKHSNEKM